MPKTEVEIPEEEFKWLANGRKSSNCAPVALVSSIGWSVISPIDVSLSPIDDVQFKCIDSELENTMSTLGLAEVWRRGESFIGLKSKSGLRLFDFKVDDHWEPMFLPNGEGTIEWRLGFDIILDTGLYVWIQGAEFEGLDVVQGIISSKILSRMSKTGFSIAIRPTGAVHIRAGDTIARIFIVNKDFIKLNSGC
ncbi:hypothetical protein FV218_06575 [Methylobacterium sp. WL69]|nr:hypothetical protein FV218_06575 [Methylobacterium sp. WL69]